MSIEFTSCGCLRGDVYTQWSHHTAVTGPLQPLLLKFSFCDCYSQSCSSFYSASGITVAATGMCRESFLHQSFAYKEVWGFRL